MLADPRLYEYLGAALLHVFTLLGVFLLVRTLFGVSCALFSVILYGLSELGLYFAGSLWPIAHPFFYVWMLYFTMRWAEERNANFLGAAIVTCAAGTYIHLVFGAGLFILPVVWFLYRPPIKIVPLVIGLAVVLLIWFPYLRFEYSRNFSDLISQILVKAQTTGNYKNSWCDPSLVILRGSKSNKQDKHRHGLNALSDTRTNDQRARGLAAGLYGNFSRSLRVPGVKSVLLGLTVLGLILLGFIARQYRQSIRQAENEEMLYHSEDITVTRSKVNHGPQLMVIFLLVPWIILILATMRAGYLVTTRFWWIWPGQIIVLAALGSFVPQYFKARPIVVLTLQVIIAVMVVCNPVLISRIQSGLSVGWFGIDSDEKKVVDFISDQIGDERKSTSIGYQTFFYGWMRYHSSLELACKNWHGVRSSP